MTDDQYFLGRCPSIRDRRTLKLRHFTRPSGRAVPPQCEWYKPVPDWGVMGNDRHGNCVIVTAAHAILAWTANETGARQRITDEAVIELSRDMGALRGYSILERLKYWRKHEMWANPLWAFASVEPDNQSELKQAIFHLGCADIGVNMPAAWQSQAIWGTGRGPSWRPNSWGAHSIPLVGYDADNVYAVTWGRIQPMTWQAVADYSDEAYALINPAWIAADTIAPSGMDLTALHEALQELAQ